MDQGCLIAVVGASGVGKDSIIAGVVESLPDIVLTRRVITRAPGLSSEDHIAVTSAEFDQARARGEFCLHWRAHGLEYGIPQHVLLDVKANERCLANLSRSVLAQADEIFPHLIVLNVVASAEAIAQRLSNRGRESDAEISSRLARSTYPLPDKLNFHQINNDGPLNTAVDQAVQLLSFKSK